MPPLVCPSCTTESSVDAYVCRQCGYSFVHQRSKPYFKLLLGSCLLASALSLILTLVALSLSGELTVVAALGWLCMHALPAQYFARRLMGQRAVLDGRLRVEPRTLGWVATDFLGIAIVAMLALFGASKFP